jgi:hypothetical protein
MVIASGLMTAGAAAWTLGKPYIIVRAAGRTDSVTDETSVTNTFFGVIGSASAVGPYTKGLPRRGHSGVQVALHVPLAFCPVLCLPFICTRRSPRVPTRQSKTSAGRHQEVSASSFISSTTNRALLEWHRDARRKRSRRLARAIAKRGPGGRGGRAPSELGLPPRAARSHCDARPMLSDARPYRWQPAAHDDHSPENELRARPLPGHLLDPRKEIAATAALDLEV